MLKDVQVAPKKRGRKSKKELELAAQQAKVEQNITVLIEDSPSSKEANESNQIDFFNLTDENNITSLNNNENNNENVNENENNNENNNEDNNDADKPIPKKRGRKPKGGKIIQQVVPISNNVETKPNVILHLKCSLKDLLTPSSSDNLIQSYTFQNVNSLSYDIINNETVHISTQLTTAQHKYTDASDSEYDDDEEPGKENDIRDIWKKL